MEKTTRCAGFGIVRRIAPARLAGWLFLLILVSRCWGAADPTDSPIPLSFGDFDTWWEQYAEAAEATRPSLVERGVTSATRRHGDMLKLMQTDPELALQKAFPEEYHAALPENIGKLIELHVRGLASLTVGRGKEEQRSRTVEMNGESYRAFVFGSRAQLKSRAELPLHGIILDGVMAVDGSPLERFPPRESLIQALGQSGGKKACPICGKPGFIPAAVGDLLLWFDSEEHLNVCEKALIEKENAPQAGP